MSIVTLQMSKFLHSGPLQVTDLKMLRRKRKLFCIFTVLFIVQLFLFYKLTRFINASNVPARWESLRGRSFADLVEPTKDTLLIRPTALHLDDVTTVVFVCSLPKSFEMRQAIRETWASSRGVENKTQVLFFVGDSNGDVATSDSLVQESEKHGDLVQDRLIESYYNLPMKVLRMMKFYGSMFNETNLQGRDPPLFVKTDEDVFVNLKNFLNAVETFWGVGSHPSKDFVAGKRFCNGNARPRRRPQSRSYMPFNMYMWLSYPCYVTGPFYAVNGHAVSRIYNRALRHDYFPFEDVLISGFLANEELNIPLVSLPNIYVEYEYINLTQSDIQNAIAIHHIKSPQIMYALFLPSQFVV